MTRYRKTIASLPAAVALACVPAAAALAQSGSILSDLSNESVQAVYRAQAAERIACDPVEGRGALAAAYQANATAKWDRAAMGCSVEYGAELLQGMNLPGNLIWAVVSFQTDNIETYLNVLGTHLEYFDVLDRAYFGHYQGIELASELGLRWERTRESGQAIVERIEPLVPKLTEARILRAAFLLASTVRETGPDEQTAALAAATEDLKIAVAEKPEALDGLGQLLLGQLLESLPSFLGGNINEAMALLEQAHALNPNDLTVQVALVETYLGERETDKAVALLNAALNIDIGSENPQDYVDEMKFLGGLAVRADQPALAAEFGARRDAMLAEKPFLLSRKEVAAMGHGGEDPFSGKDPSDLN